MAWRPAGPARLAVKTAAAAAFAASRRSLRPFSSRRPSSNSGTAIPRRAARCRTASGKLIPSRFITNPITFPPSPHPKQWKMPRSGFTVNEGVFSP